MKLYKAVESISDLILSKIIGLDDMAVFQKPSNCLLFTTDNNIDSKPMIPKPLPSQPKNQSENKQKPPKKLKIEDNIIYEEINNKDKESKLSSPRWPDKSDISINIRNEALSKDKRDLLSYNSNDDDSNNDSYSNISDNSSVNIHIDNRCEDEISIEQIEKIDVNKETKTMKNPKGILKEKESADSITECKSMNIVPKKKKKKVKKVVFKDKAKTIYHNEGKSNNNSMISGISDNERSAKSMNTSTISSNRTFKRKKLNISNIFA